MSKKLPEHLTKGGPGDQYLGGGKVDTSKWFGDNRMNLSGLDKRIKDQEIYFCAAPFQLLYTDVKGDYGPCSWADTDIFKTNIKDVTIKDFYYNNIK